MSMDYVKAVPLASSTIALETPTGEVVEYTTGGNRYFVTEKTDSWFYRELLRSVEPGMPDAVDRAIQEHGYQTERELISYCYGLPEFVSTRDGEIIYASNLPDKIALDLSDDECDDLELSFNPKLIVPMHRLAEALGDRRIDWSQVKQVERMPLPGP